MQEVVDFITQLETGRFSVNEYRGLGDALPFSIAGGDLPLVISAPHAVSQWREGRVKPSDDFTGALAIATAQLVGCYSMVASRYDEHDYNWDPFETCAYKQALADFVRDRGIVAVIDVHGVPSASPSAIEIGSADGASVKALPGADERALGLMQRELAPFLEKHGKTVVLNERHGARGRNTVTNAIARECGIAALQIEIATPFRVPAYIGGHTPKGEAIPFTPSQIPAELSSRRNPDPACVVATMHAIARLARQLLGGCGVGAEPRSGMPQVIQAWPPALRRS